MIYLKNALEDYIKAHFDEYEFVNVRAARLIDLVVKDDGVYHNDGSGEYKLMFCTAASAGTFNG